MKYNTNRIDLNHLNLDQILFCGDIHGKYHELCNEISAKYDNTMVIVCGDIGLGFDAELEHIDDFRIIDAELAWKNNYFVFVRGNHDDPAYFKDTLRKCKYLAEECSNVIIMDDYDLLMTKFGNILAIGGARSVDKCYRTPGKTWWEGENIVFPDTERLGELLHDTPNIDIIVSHSSPHFCEPLTKKGLEQWAVWDKNVIKDCDKERALLTSIYEILFQSHNIKNWFYGHFHNSYYMINERHTKFHGLGIDELKSLNAETE